MPDKRDRVIIQYPDGRTYGCASPEVAREHHPGARILRYADGHEYVAPAPPQAPERQSPNAPRGTGRRMRSAGNAAVQSE